MEVVMARVELEDSWISRGDVGAIRADLLVFLKLHNMRVVEESDAEIRVKQGSQILTRLLGGWFVSPAWLPKRAMIEFQQAKDGVHVQAMIEESLGFGFMDPILSDKYRKYFEQWMDDLNHFLHQRKVAGSSASAEPRDSAPARKKKREENISRTRRAAAPPERADDQGYVDQPPASAE